jgi:hypothetical protein
MFWHLPGFLSAVVQAALVQTSPRSLLAHGPAATMPARCKRPEKPVNCEHVPAWLTAVKTINMTPATITNTRGIRNEALGATVSPAGVPSCDAFPNVLSNSDKPFLISLE